MADSGEAWEVPQSQEEPGFHSRDNQNSQGLCAKVTTSGLYCEQAIWRRERTDHWRTALRSRKISEELL